MPRISLLLLKEKKRKKRSSGLIYMFSTNYQGINIGLRKLA